MVESLAFLVSLGAFAWGIARWRRTGNAGEILTPGIADLRLDEDPERDS